SAARIKGGGFIVCEIVATLARQRQVVCGTVATPILRRDMFNREILGGVGLLAETVCATALCTLADAAGRGTVAAPPVVALLGRGPRVVGSGARRGGVLAQGCGRYGQGQGQDGRAACRHGWQGVQTCPEAALPWARASQRVRPPGRAPPRFSCPWSLT